MKRANKTNAKKNIEASCFSIHEKRLVADITIKDSKRFIRSIGGLTYNSDSR